MRFNFGNNELPWNIEDSGSGYIHIGNTFNTDNTWIIGELDKETFVIFSLIVRKA